MFNAGRGVWDMYLRVNKVSARSYLLSQANSADDCHSHCSTVDDCGCELRPGRKSLSNLQQRSPQPGRESLFTQDLQHEGNLLLHRQALQGSSIRLADLSV